MAVRRMRVRGVEVRVYDGVKNESEKLLSKGE